MDPKQKYADRPSSETEEDIPFLPDGRPAYAQGSALSKTLKIILAGTVLVALTLAVASLSVASTQCVLPTSNTNSWAGSLSVGDGFKHYAGKLAPGEDDDDVIYDCGESVEEALAKGCIYDSMLPAWTHPKCYNRTLDLEFRALGGWKWYSRSDGEEEISWDSVETGLNEVMWTNHEYHVMHCLYMWRKLAIALSEEGQWINQILLSEPHTHHCIKMVNAPRVSPNATSARSTQTFETCRKVKWQNLIIPEL